MKKGNMLMLFLAALAAVVVGAGPAFATWTVDLAGVTTDLTTIGLAILALVAIVFGFRVVRGMIGR